MDKYMQAVIPLCSKNVNWRSLEAQICGSFDGCVVPSNLLFYEDKHSLAC